MNSTKASLILCLESILYHLNVLLTRMDLVHCFRKYKLSLVDLRLTQKLRLYSLLVSWCCELLELYSTKLLGV